MKNPPWVLNSGSPPSAKPGGWCAAKISGWLFSRDELLFVAHSVVQAVAGTLIFSYLVDLLPCLVDQQA